MDQGFDINAHIKRELLNVYGGSERKKTVILDDGGRYLLKFPDPVREEGRAVSYINNALSEYLGSRIMALLGIPTQEVRLGTYHDAASGKTKVACLCRDVRPLGWEMHEASKISLSSLDKPRGAVTFAAAENIIGHLDTPYRDTIRQRYYNMFVGDALLGNTDRHNGNWAVLTDPEGNIYPCPVYDCGSSLSPLLDDSELTPSIAQNEALNVRSAICDDKGRRIRYATFLGTTDNPRIHSACRAVVPHARLGEIEGLIDATPYLSDIRRDFYKALIRARMEKVLVPALERALPATSEEAEERSAMLSGDVLRYIGTSLIGPIKKLPAGRETVLANTRHTGASVSVVRMTETVALVMLQDGTPLGTFRLANNRGNTQRLATLLEDALNTMGLGEGAGPQDFATL